MAGGIPAALLNAQGYTGTEANAPAALLTLQGAGFGASYPDTDGDGTPNVPYVGGGAWVLDPYVSGNFGPFSYFAEAIYASGEADYEVQNAAANQTSIDVEAFTYQLEGKYKAGPATIRAGYWFMSGDNNTDDNKMEAIGYIESNLDVDIAFILTGNSHELGFNNSLGGGLGNFSGDTLATAYQSGTTAMAGAKVLYAGVGFDVTDNLNIDLAFINAKVDKPPGTNYVDTLTQVSPGVWTLTNYSTDWDDDVGNEYDFKLSWYPMQNLEYRFRAGYLTAGDYWKRGNANAKIDDMYAMYHGLFITF